MNVKYFTVIGIALFAFSQAAIAQDLNLEEVYGDLDEYGNKRVSGEYSFDVFVQCLNADLGDYLHVDVNYDTVIHSRKNGPTWMFSAQWRQSGTAHDSSGNTWKFNGHWKVNETSEDPDWQNREHLTVVENDLFVSDTGAENLKLTYTREVRWRDGIRIKRTSDFYVTCL